jgi:HK97 gp10 family phage protein
MRQNLAAALEEQAQALQAEAQRRCPVQTGRLRSSIRACVTVQGDTFTAEIGSGLPYAVAAELGAPGRPPAPFLAPALRARNGEILEQMKRAVHCALEGEER